MVNQKGWLAKAAAGECRATDLPRFAPSIRAGLDIARIDRAVRRPAKSERGKSPSASIR